MAIPVEVVQRACVRVQILRSCRHWTDVFVVMSILTIKPYSDSWYQPFSLLANRLILILFALEFLAFNCHFIFYFLIR